MPDALIKGFKCYRCNWEWVSNKKDDDRPITCPKCRSAYWDKLRLHSEAGLDG